ncbi:hypothetical protein [Amycolatopsis plumensis]|uniref:hypothetical protein n=1 Tax=Amycolatopsis plumensis TaxID=236508 RepID=UPI003612778B
MTRISPCFARGFGGRGEFLIRHRVARGDFREHALRLAPVPAVGFGAGLQLDARLRWAPTTSRTRSASRRNRLTSGSTQVPEG